MMKNILRSAIAVLLVIVLVSWGYEGHRAVAEIGENHLTPTAKQAVKKLLLGGTMADAANFADDIRSTDQYRFTAPFHYLNVPLGYDFAQFSTYVKNNPMPNIYNAMVACIKDLQDPNKTSMQKTFDLKLLIHFIGDAHQPMHVSREEDKGGNKIIVRYFGQNTDLHGLWDEGMFYQKKLVAKDIVAMCNDATPEQIKKWQSDDVMVWLWESYQVTTILYQEAASDPNFNEKYYQDHLPILKNRIEKAGIRLAGVLNDIYR